MARIILGTLVLAAIATFWWHEGGEKDFEQVATRIAIEQQAGAVCQLSSDAIRHEDVGLVSICATYGVYAYESARRYPDIAGEIFGQYGELPEFREILDRYGHVVLPVIQYYREREGSGLNLGSRFKNLEARFKGENPDSRAAQLSPDQKGYIGIHEIERGGHRLLSQFELVDTGAKRKQLRRVLDTALDVFTSGMTELEAAIVRGEKPTWKQIGYAMIDASVVVGGAAVIATTFRTAKNTAKAASFFTRLRLASGTALTVTKTVVAVGTVATIYIVATNPKYLVAMAAWVAEQTGLPAWVGVLVLATVFGAAIMVTIEVLLKILRFPLKPFVLLYKCGIWFAPKLKWGWRFWRTRTH